MRVVKTIKKKTEADSYLTMIRLFPLRPIRNGIECEQATRILDEYFPRGDLDRGTADYIQVLAGLVAEYEEKHDAVDTSQISPLDLLKHLMESNNMTIADLGRLLGNSGLASMILHGDRSISKTNAKILGKRFGLNAGAFI